MPSSGSFADNSMTSGHRATTERAGLRVLFVTHAYPRRAGDAPGSFVHRLALALVARDVQVRVLAPSAPGLAAREDIDGVPVERFRYAPRAHERLAYTGTMAEAVQESVAGKLALLGMLAAGRQSLRRAARAFAPHLVHAHWWFPSGLVARASALPVPFMVTMHGSDVRLAAGTKGAARLYTSVARSAAAMAAVSSWLAARAASLSPALPAPTVAPMPVDIALFAPRGPRDPDKLLFVGRLNAQKGAATLLHALARARPSLTLDIVGDGPDAQTLRTLARELGVAERVRWLGVLDQPALAERYARAGALVVPSVDEGLGLVAVEAALCETPVIASRSGGLTDVVKDGVTGLLTDPGDPAALAGALDALADRDDAGAALGREGRRRALERFAPEAVAARYHALYESINATPPA